MFLFYLLQAKAMTSIYCARSRYPHEQDRFKCWALKHSDEILNYTYCSLIPTRIVYFGNVHCRHIKHEEQTEIK